MNTDLKRVIARRQRLIQLWPRVAGILALATIGFYAWAFVKQPVLVNPLHVIGLLQDKGLDTATQTLLCVMAPVLFLVIGVLLLLLLLFVTAGLINEGRLMRLLDQTEHG